MNNTLLQHKEVRAYTLLTSLVICGLAGSLITAHKIVQVGVNFPFSNIVFSIFTYPIVDCICELWGKQAARQTMWLALSSQLLLTFIIQLSIFAPHASFWQQQSEYQTILSTGVSIVLASIIAFAVSQMLDIVIYQRIKELSKGKFLWLRSNISTYLGQIIDSSIFVMLVFHDSDQKYNILIGSVIVKIILSLLMTPFVYLIVMTVNRYLSFNTLAFKNEMTFIKETV
jgi:queuosine precursor transporter